MLQVEHVSKTYRGRRALEDVSLQVGRAEIVGLLGRNGAGKSTLFRILNGVEVADGGRCRLPGRAEFISCERRIQDRIRLAMAKPPSLVILDEPFAGVDPREVPGIAASIRDLPYRGTSVLLMDHHVRGALEICDRAYVLEEGRIVLAEAAPDLLARMT